MLRSTPVEKHNIVDPAGIPWTTAYVKREDLCCPGGPPFSKMRGVVAHIKNRDEQVIGVLDTFHSQAGWAVSFACEALGRHCVNFWPKYKKDRGMQPQQLKSQELGAELVDFTAGRSAILYHRARAYMAREHPGSYLMPNALKLDESVSENAEEASRTASSLPGRGTLVISISSGTVAAGVIKGLGGAEGYDVVLHMGYSRSEDAARSYMEKMSGCDLSKATFVDEGYGYADSAAKACSWFWNKPPFPCNEFYDLKAWKWLQRPGVLDGLRKPITFWNIGE